MQQKKRKRYGNYDGRNGAKARAEKLTPERRREIATKAANTRWAVVRANQKSS